MANASLTSRDYVENMNSRYSRLHHRTNREERIYPLPIYVETDAEHKPFFDYLLPSERCILKTGNMEHIHPKERQTKYFSGRNELDEYLAESFSASSHDEEYPPASEECFIDEHHMEHFDRFHRNASGCPSVPPLTKMQKRLLKSLADFHITTSDNTLTVEAKKHKRLELVRGHCKRLKRKRYARTFKRFTKTREKKLDVAAEAAELREQEIKDKDLLRTEGQPLMDARVEAIKKKFELYAADAEFRKMYRERVYLNVNLDVEDDEEINVPMVQEKQPTYVEPSTVPAPNQQNRSRVSQMDKKLFQQYRREAFELYLSQSGLDIAERVHRSMSRRA